jgi:alkanesulfonate monooxygenase SsuD/methylene tetrahydromethanopterin reductase-like flavin-dependent oxidoreductase (luciferase family)
MKLGIFAMPLHHPDRDWRTVLQEDREMIILADKLGYSEVWIGEHVASKGEPITYPLMFLASVIGETEHIKLGTGVINLPHRHPAHVAGEVAMLDQMSNGRVLFGIGPGGLSCDAELFDHLDGDERGRMMVEAIDIMEYIWTSDPPYEFNGEFWNISVKDAVIPYLGVGQMGKPLQKPFPPIAYAMRSPRSAASELAADRDWIPIAGNFIPSDFVRSQWEGFEEACTKLGKPADRNIWRVARSILVADSDTAADAYVNAPDGMFRFYFRYLFTLSKMRGRPGEPDATAKAEIEAQVDDALKTMVIAGGADTVLDKLVAFRDEVGHFGTLIATGHDWDDAGLWRNSMHALAEDVLPRFSAHADSK